MADILELHPDNDTNASLTLGTTGLTVTAHIQATRFPGGTAIHADLTPTITEVGATGTYTGVIQGSAITARLTNATPTYTNKLVYLIWKVGTDFHSYRTCVVKDSRVAE